MMFINQNFNSQSHFKIVISAHPTSFLDSCKILIYLLSKFTFYQLFFNIMKKSSSNFIIIWTFSLVESVHIAKKQCLYNVTFPKTFHNKTLGAEPVLLYWIEGIILSFVGWEFHFLHLITSYITFLKDTQIER